MKANSVLSVLFFTLLAFVAITNAIAAGPVQAPPPVQPKPPVVPPNPKPGPIGSPKLPTRLPDLPLPRDVDSDVASKFQLTSPPDGDNDQTLFENLNGQTLPFFLKLYDTFAAEDNYIEDTQIYEKLPEDQRPFQRGEQPSGKPMDLRPNMRADPKGQVSSRFDPKAPSDICRAWSSLNSYCGNRDTDCACYSSTYYVPDQWNSLAAGCAKITTICTAPDAGPNDPWCLIGQTAASFKTLCEHHTDAVKFAATVDVETTTAKPASSAKTTRDAASTPRLTATSSTQNTVTSSTTPAPTSRSIFVVSTTSTTSSNVNSSHSSHSLDFDSACVRSWAIIFATFVIYL